MSNAFHQHLVLFGGSFNPPHLGHLTAAEGLLKNPGVKKVVVLPSYGNPLKPEMTSFEERHEMTKLNFPEFEVSRFEEKQKIKSSFELLSQVKLLTGEHPIAFAIGTDQFETLEHWVNFPHFLNLCDWIVLLRKPKKLDDCGKMIRKYETDGLLKATRDYYTFEIGHGGVKRMLRFVETDAPATSSTQIREQFALGKKEHIKPYLKAEVFDYIERKSLYGA